MSLKPYTDYKDSGAIWLAAVPASWSISPLGHFFTERSQTVSDKEFQPLSVTMQGIVPQMENVAKTENGDNRKLVRRGDFVINSRSDRKGSSGIADRDGSVSVISIVLEPRSISPRFVHHLLRSTPFQEEFYRFGSGIVADLWSTRFSSMKSIRLAVPTLSEQNTIADYLDHETAEIDTFIADQEELIVLLNERRAATITQAVTKGLDPNVPMKDSGVEWMGAIPKSWHIAKLGWYSTCNSGKSISADDVEAVDDADHKYPVIGGNGSMGFAESFNVSTPMLVIGRVGALCGNVHVVTDPAWVTDNALRLTVTKKYVLQFLAHLLRTRDLNSLADKTAQPLITGTLVSRQRVPLPPVETQIEIAEYLRNETTEIDAAIDDARQAIKLSKERRSALISATVTGKIDIRDALVSKRQSLEGELVVH